jgi:predicted ester cyclase
MTTIESNKQVVLKYVEAFNRGDLEALQELFTPDALIHSVLGWGELDKAMPIWKELHEAFAINLTVEEIIAEGDTVAVRYTERGAFVGSFRGQEPTGKSFELVAMERFTVLEGKIQRRWAARDAASQARQLGMNLG